MNSAHVSRRNSPGCGLLGLVLGGLFLGATVNAVATELDNAPRDTVFVAQTLPPRPTRLSSVIVAPDARPLAARPSPLPDLDADEIFAAESFADGDLPSCSTVAGLAERLLGTCLRQGLSAPDKALTQRLLYSAEQPNRTDAWSRDTESLFRLAQCAGSLSDQRLVAGAALAAAEAQLQNAAPSAPRLSAFHREHAQRAQWLWTYRLAVLDVEEGNFFRAGATLFRLHRTAPTHSLLAHITTARQLLQQQNGERAGGELQLPPR